MGKLTNLTVKGQVTIPKDVRDALGLVANQPVEIEMLGDDAAVIRKPTLDRESKIQQLIAQMRAASDDFAHLRENRPTDEIMRDIRGTDPFPP
jgi:AbrB family looped-hinge helix DNA binding protein